LGEGTGEASIDFRCNAGLIERADYGALRVSARITFSEKWGWGLLAGIMGMTSASREDYED